MSDSSSSRKARALTHLITRRGLVGQASVAAMAVGVAPTIAQTRQDASPGETPGASPAATPEPEILPDHALTIVQDQKPVYSSEPVQGGTLRLYARSGNLRDFSPTAQRQDMQALISVLDPLVWIDEVTMEPRPWLATAWEWSDDGLSLSFDLRTDVAFHDGTPFTANDARFSLLAYRDDYDSATSGIFAMVADVIADSDNRITVSFVEPDGAFLFNAASQPVFSSAQYADHWAQHPVGERSLSGFDWELTPPIGTGPWILDRSSDDELVFRRNDTYWAGPPHFDELRLIAEDDRDRRIEGWKRGDVDVLWPVRSTDLDAVWDEEGRLYAAPSPAVFFAAFNMANPANVTSDMMADPALRQALTLAVDRESYAREVFFGFIKEQRAGTITQPWAHDDSLRNPAFDIDEANRILDEAAWADIDGDGMREDWRGNELNLYLIVSTQERPELLAIIDRLGEDWAKIGARLTVQVLEPDVFDDRWVENRMYDMIAYSLVEYPAFTHFDLYGTAWDIRSNIRGWNPGGYSNAAVDAAINDYFTSITTESMRSALVDLQQTANDDLFGLWFGFPNDLVLVRKDIQGFVPNMYFQTYATRSWWRGEGTVGDESPEIPVVFWDQEG